MGFNVSEATKTGARWTPFFPELWQEWEWFKSTQTKKSEYLFPRYRKLCESALHTNLRRQLKEIGIKSWPVLLHSLRTRFINWLERKGVNEKAKTDWVGNDENTRDTYYLRGAAEDLERVFADCANFNGSATENLPSKSPLLAEKWWSFCGQNLPSSASSALVPAENRLSLFDVLIQVGKRATEQAKEIRRKVRCANSYEETLYISTREEYLEHRRWCKSEKKRAEHLEMLGAVLDFGVTNFFAALQEIGVKYPLGGG